MSNRCREGVSEKRGKGETEEKRGKGETEEGKGDKRDAQLGNIRAKGHARK